MISFENKSDIKMKKLIIIASLVATVGVNFSCSDSFFAIEPQGAASFSCNHCINWRLLLSRYSDDGVVHH